MSTQGQPRLLFIKSPLHNLSAIESYLKKRGFEIHTQDQLKEGLLLALQLKPDFVFVAWDYPSEHVYALPKIISESYSPQIIPYILSVKKDHIEKLQASAFKTKITPPFSGPGLQRLILSLLKNPERSAQHAIRPPTTPSGGNISASEKNKADLIDFIKKIETIEPLSDVAPELQGDRHQRAKILRTKQGPKPLHSQTSTKPFFSQKKVLTGEQQERLSKYYEKKVAAEIEEILMTLADDDIQTSANSIKQKGFVLGDEPAASSFCMIIDSPIWAGYLLVASEYAIDFIYIEALLNNWVRENITTNDENLDPVSFAITLAPVDFLDFSNQVADFTKIIIVQTKKTVLTFFSLESSQVSFQIHDTQDMIEIPVTDIRPSLPIPFPLHLYLPENKRFILYSKENAQIEDHQLGRLIEKQIANFYSPIHFEQTIQKMRAEDTMNTLIKTYETKKKDILK